MKWLSKLSLILLFLSSSMVKAEQNEQAENQVQVVEAFADIHTGPAKGYPVFYVAEKGEWLTILKRRTNWFKVKLASGKEGWIKQSTLHKTISATGKPVTLFDGSFESYQERNAEIFVAAGSLDSVSALSVSGVWVWTPNIATELSYTQALGDFASNKLALVSIQHSMFPEWKVSPYISLGAGAIVTKPKANLVQSGDESRTSDVLSIGVGARYYLNRNFILRVEYKNLLVDTDRDVQEELNQWNLGFAVFF